MMKNMHIYVVASEGSTANKQAVRTIEHCVSDTCGKREGWMSIFDIIRRTKKVAVGRVSNGVPIWFSPSNPLVVGRGCL